MTSQELTIHNSECRLSVWASSLHACHPAKTEAFVEYIEYILLSVMLSRLKRHREKPKLEDSRLDHGQLAPMTLAPANPLSSASLRCLPLAWGI